MFNGKLIKKNGKLSFADDKSRLGYQIFVDKLPEGQLVDMYIDITDNKHTGAQLKKVHACIRELAKESGYTFEEMKLLVKKQSGLCIEAEGVFECKSFAECSKDEISLAIEACIEIGAIYNISFPE
jgi:hypothetical protein